MAISAILPNAIPPSDERVEQRLLSTILADSSALTQIGLLQAGDFADPVNRSIFESMAVRYASGLPLDVLTLKADFETSNALEEVGGVTYLQQLALLAPLASVPRAAETIRDFSQRRRQIEVFELQRREAEEGLLEAFGIGSRTPARVIGLRAAARCSEVSAFHKAIIQPHSPLLADTFENSARVVVLLVREILELAAYHETMAVQDEQAGNEAFGEARRARAQQLRTMLGEVQA